MRLKQLYPTLAVLAFATSAVARIPMPDAVLYGRVDVDGVPAGAADDLTVLAYVDGADAPVAVYRMGDFPTAGDRFVLQLPMATQDDGATPSPGTARPGMTARVFVRHGSGPEVHLADAVIPESGEAKELSLSSTTADLPVDSALEDPPRQGCGSGICGSTGLVSLLMTVSGLVQMKRGRRRVVRIGQRL